MLRKINYTPAPRRKQGKHSLQGILRTIERVTSPVGQETVPCLEALGRIAALTVRASQPLPAFDVSALDGFACKGSGNGFVVRGSMGPGEKMTAPLYPGEAIFVATGAAIPPGCRFVPVEQVQEENARILVDPSAEVRKIWKKGYWIKKSAEVVRKGERIRPRTMELLSLARLHDISVYRKPKVGILSTGNELKKGIVPNSNQHLLSGLVQRDGGEIAKLITVADDDQEIGEALKELSSADLLLVTGGTAMGKRDLTRSSLAARGAIFHLATLPLVPGKTMSFGELDRRVFFILPGNPRALRSLYEIFIRPCLCKLGGSAGRLRRGKAVAPRGLQKETEWIHLIPVALSRDGRAHIAGLQVDEPDAVMILDRGVTKVKRGSEVEIQWIDM